MFRNFSLIVALTLAGRGSDGSPGSDDDRMEDFALKPALPESLTGGATGSASRRMAGKITEVARGGGDEPCRYLGPENEDDPFCAGYETTRFMVSIMATWTCLADLLIELSDRVPRDGKIDETDSDMRAPGYESDEPIHYSVTAEPESQVTLRLYHTYPRSAPPRVGEAAQFYLAWIDSGKQAVDGRMIVDAGSTDAAERKPDDPEMMRMDFSFRNERPEAVLYLRFDRHNYWAEGFRIQITRDERARPLGQVFTARGLIRMTRQLLPLPGIDEIPELRFFTVSDLLGNGAAIEEVRDLSLPLIVNIFKNNHLGDYLFNKLAMYFFEDDKDWEYIHRTVVASEYRGARNTAASGGSWLPFDPSPDMIIGALALDSDYFTGSQCARPGDECNRLLDAIFIDGFAGQGKNQGSDPLDWGSHALAGANHLETVFPNGRNWSGAFAQSYTPNQ